MDTTVLPRALILIAMHTFIPTVMMHNYWSGWKLSRLTAKWLLPPPTLPQLAKVDKRSRLTGKP
eukprot:1284650-Rhodomonas_salina.1